MGDESMPAAISFPLMIFLTDRGQAAGIIHDGLPMIYITSSSKLAEEILQGTNQKAEIALIHDLDQFANLAAKVKGFAFALEGMGKQFIRSDQVLALLEKAAHA